MVELIHSVQKAGIAAKYVVFDSWFSSPKTIQALKKEENGWLFSADCLVGEQKEHYACFESFPIPAEDAAGFLQIISEDGEIKKLYRHRNPMRFFHISDVPARSLGMTFCDGSTMEKDAELGDRALDYLYVLADRYYKDAESSAETPPDTATS